MNPANLLEIAYVGDTKFKNMINDNNTYYGKCYKYIIGEIPYDEYVSINKEYLLNDNFRKGIMIKCISYIMKWTNMYDIIHNMSWSNKFPDLSAKYHYDKLKSNDNLLIKTYIEYIDFLHNNIDIQNWLTC